jgi:hypothetical protein
MLSAQVILVDVGVSVRHRMVDEQGERAQRKIVGERCQAEGCCREWPFSTTSQVTINSIGCAENIANIIHWSYIILESFISLLASE